MVVVLHPGRGAARCARRARGDDRRGAGLGRGHGGVDPGRDRGAAGANRCRAGAPRRHARDRRARHRPADRGLRPGRGPRDRPRRDGGRVPGHPVLFGRRFFESLAALEGDRGARDLLREGADYVVEIRLGGQAAVTDLDTPEAWERGARPVRTGAATRDRRCRSIRRRSRPCVDAAGWKEPEEARLRSADGLGDPVSGEEWAMTAVTASRPSPWPHWSGRM